jgi:UDP-3-O-[3-hydroxymyristoyl] glucosamine N-acyltransferase
MAKRHDGWRLGSLAQLLGGELVGDPDILILRPGLSHTTDAQAITFATDAAFLATAEQSSAAAVLVPVSATSSKPHIKVASPRAAFGHFLAIYRRDIPLAAGIHSTAIVASTATVDPSASVGAYAVVEDGARIGPKCHVHPFCYVGEDCVLDESVTLYPHVTLIQDVRIGAHSTVHSGTVLGADGFGYVWNGTSQQKVPQVGGVSIGSHVEIGALTAVDRAVAGDTEIGDDVKLDNFVQVAHNVRIGAHTVIASHVGVSGSVHIGHNVTVAGQCGFRDGVSIADNVILLGRSGVTKSITEPGTYAGYPVTPALDSHRSTKIVEKLPDLIKRIRQLEAKVAELEGK